MSLRDTFKADVMAAIERCYDIGYSPNIFKRMIEAQHPVEVGKKLVLSGEFQYGIKELSKLGHLELTIEHIMLDPKYRELFNREHLDAAKWRLDNVDSVA